MMVLNMEDVTQDSLLQVFKRFKFDAKLAGKNEVSVESGVDIPIIVKIRPKDKSIVLIGKAVSIENSLLKDVEDIAEIAKDRYPVFPMKAVEDDDDWPFLLMEKSFSYENGVPLRLLFRLAKSFSTAFHRNVILKKFLPGMWRIAEKNNRFTDQVQVADDAEYPQRSPHRQPRLQLKRHLLWAGQSTAGPWANDP
jgi:hypothetical protein